MVSYQYSTRNIADLPVSATWTYSAGQLLLGIAFLSFREREILYGKYYDWENLLCNTRCVKEDSKPLLYQLIQRRDKSKVKKDNNNNPNTKK